VLLVGGRVNEGEEVVQNAEIFEEVATETPSAPPMTLASVRQLLMDPNQDVVDETTAWLVELGPQVKPILLTLLDDESPELRRLVSGILQSIDVRNYPTVWCVEVWDATGRLDTVWLDSFEGPESYDAANPHKHFTAVLRATEGVNLTHLVVRFPAHTPYEVRVKLFNLVGWTRISKVVLGENLSEEDLARVANPAAK
jgi:hypothetical protein